MLDGFLQMVRRNPGGKGVCNILQTPILLTNLVEGPRHSWNPGLFVEVVCLPGIVYVVLLDYVRQAEKLLLLSALEATLFLSLGAFFWRTFLSTTWRLLRPWAEGRLQLQCRH